MTDRPGSHTGKSRYDEDTAYDVLLEGLRDHMKDFEIWLQDRGVTLKTSMQYAALVRSMMRRIDLRDPVLFEATLREYSTNSVSQRRTCRNKYLEFIGMSAIDVREQRDRVKENPKEVWVEKRKRAERVQKNLERALYSYLDYYEKRLIPAEKDVLTVVTQHVVRWEQAQEKMKEQRARVVADNLARREAKLRNTTNDDLTGSDIGPKDAEFALKQLERLLNLDAHDPEDLESSEDNDDLELE